MMHKLYTEIWELKIMAKIYLLSNQIHTEVGNLEVFKIEYIESKIDLLKYDANFHIKKCSLFFKIF